MRASQPNAPGVLRAQLPFDQVLIAGQAVDGLAAIAAAGAMADLLGFEQAHRKAAFGQFDGGGQARQPAAHDGHVAGRMPLQRRMARVPYRRGGVVRAAREFAVGAEEMHV